ncbi:MAG: polysaccharide biosynthesis/export family protein [Acidobacteria bacterium]|nr:polysaccharide biosynthesis/export family protein [Acidobacteriota bacterium]
MYRYSLFVLCLSVCLGTLANAQQSSTPAPAAEKPVEGTAPAKLGDDLKNSVAGVDPKSFQIGAEDILGIQVWREPDFSRQVMVRPDGKITLPLINEVQAAGLTPDQLTASLTQNLSKFLNNPQVIVSVMQVNSKKYYITGGVLKPGSFPLVVPTRVLEALSASGGFRDFANTKKIVILRKGQRLKFNWKEVTKGKNTEQNIYLENGDYIIVPE